MKTLIRPIRIKPERAGLERDLTADGVEALRRPVEDDRGRVVLRRRRRLVELGLGRVEALDARDGRHDDQHDRAIHTTMRTRSRRTANRVSGAVPLSETSLVVTSSTSPRRSASSASCASSSP